MGDASGGSSRSLATSQVPVQSTVHGRLRREQRNIAKRDLQVAVKHGKREVARRCRVTGKTLRWKFTYGDVVYITDEKCLVEITSWLVDRPARQGAAAQGAGGGQAPLDPQQGQRAPPSPSEAIILDGDVPPNDPLRAGSQAGGLNATAAANLNNAPLIDVIDLTAEEGHPAGEADTDMPDAPDPADPPRSEMTVPEGHRPAKRKQAAAVAGQISPRQISDWEDLAHSAAKAQVLAHPATWTSHTVIVVDQSGSMRNSDMADGSRRSDSMWSMLAYGFVQEQLEKGAAKGTDVVSIISMSVKATLLVDREPLDWLLFNRLGQLQRDCQPASHGNYTPALALAERLLTTTTAAAGCALMLMFLSDGRPSDPTPPGNYLGTVEKLGAGMAQQVASLASRLGRRMTIGTIGFGESGEDFSVLRDMARAAAPYGCKGSFQRPELSAPALKSAFSSLSTSLTATRLELTESSVGMAKWTVREIKREPAAALPPRCAFPSTEDVRTDPTWVYFPWPLVRSRRKWSVPGNAWEDVADKFASPFASGVAFRRAAFGEGAERVVRVFAEVDDSGRRVGEHWVAKESRFLEDPWEGVYHKVFCETQARAKLLAKEFNRRLAQIRGVDQRTPRVKFLDCYVYVVQDPKEGEIALLVERMLDPKRYQKWNTNDGHVDGVLSGANGLEAIQEGEEQDEGEDAGRAGGGNASMPGAIRISARDIPQAFSHFTHFYSRGRMLVCDLQGVFDSSSSPPVFALTDPVVHYASQSGRQNVFGRTDRGVKGIQSFVETHKCSPLCHALQQMWQPDPWPVAWATGGDARGPPPVCTAGVSQPDSGTVGGQQAKEAVQSGLQGMRQEVSNLYELVASLIQELHKMHQDQRQRLM